MTKPFVGRARELQELQAGLEDAASGRGCLFVISGEPGIGKTRLADEVAGVAAARGFRVAWGRCWQGGGAPTYWPWAQVLRAFGAELPAVPTAVSDAAHARFALFQEVLGVLGHACATEPCVIVFDDLHAADPSSLVLLRLVVGELRALRVAIVATCRDRDAQLGPESASILASITREGTYVPMRRFLAQEIVALGERMGVILSEGTRAAVFRVTDGHPLFVDQVLRLLAARGEDGAVDIERIPIPFSVREAIRERLSTLEREAREMLDVAAVLGQEMSIRLLAFASGQQPRDLVAHVASAVGAGVLVEQGEGRIAFSHILLRDELYVALDEDRRVAVHASAANMAAPDQSLDALAHHAIEARAVLGSPKAAELALRAGESSIQGLAFEDAATLLERALGALESSLPPSTVVDLLLARGLALIRTGAIDRGKHACERAAALARTAGDASRLARAALTYGTEHTPPFVDRQLVALLEESLTVLPEDERALRARVLARLAAALQPAPDPGVPMRMAREAIASAEHLDQATRRATFYAAASALADWGDPHERIALNLEMAKLAAGAGDKVQALRSHARLVFDFMEAGDVRSADVHLGIHESLAKEFREPRYRWLAVLMRAMRALFEGRLEDVDRLQAEGEKIVGPDGDGTFHSTALWQRCHRLLDEERFDDLTALEPRVRALLAPVPHGRLLLAVLLGRIHSRTGEREKAAAELAALGDLRPPTAGPLIAGMLAETYACAGSATQQEYAYGALLPFADRLLNLGFSGMAVEAPITRLLGLLASATGRTSDALRHFDDAIARLESLGAPRWLARTRRERDAAARGRTGIASVPSSARPAAPSMAGFTLRSEGEYFAVSYGDSVVRLKDSRGLRILAYLVEHPGQEHHVLTLAGAFDEASGDAGDLLDREAGARYRERIEDLREQLEEAESFSDVARAARLREELDALGTELARGFGLGGRARKAGSAAERARVNVQRHLRKTIRKIGESEPNLEKYLEWTVKTGAYCSYRPP